MQQSAQKGHRISGCCSLGLSQVFTGTKVGSLPAVADSGGEALPPPSIAISPRQTPPTNARQQLPRGDPRPAASRGDSGSALSSSLCPLDCQSPAQRRKTKLATLLVHAVGVMPLQRSGRGGKQTPANVLHGRGWKLSSRKSCHHLRRHEGLLPLSHGMTRAWASHLHHSGSSIALPGSSRLDECLNRNFKLDHARGRPGATPDNRHGTRDNRHRSTGRVRSSADAFRRALVWRLESSQLCLAVASSACG